MAVNFPGSIDTTATLYSPFNEYKWKSRLKYTITEAQAVLTLTDLSNIISELANNFIGIDNEIMFVQSIDNSGAEKKITVLRGQGGSVAAIHSAGVEVIQTYVAEYHKKLVEAIIAVETYAKSGDMPLDNLTQITTRNHNDLQNLNAASAHPSASIDNTSTAYGRGLATTDNTVQKIADRVNKNGTSQFKTDKSKCNLLLDFKDGLTDKTRGINPVGYELANRWIDNFINDSTSKASATNISCTLKQFDGDEGKFGAGVAVEESRTNIVPYSQDSTQWWGNIVATNIISPVGVKGGQYTNATDSSCLIIPNVQLLSGKVYTLSFWIKSSETATSGYWIGSAAGMIYDIKPYWTRKSYVLAAQTANTTRVQFGAYVFDNLKVEIDGIDIQEGSFPTSYIATGATAVTRPAGKFQIEGKNIPKVGTISFWAKMIKGTSDYQHFFDINSIHNTLHIYMQLSVNKIYAGIGPTAYELDTYNENRNHYIITYDYVNNIFKAYYNGILKGTVIGTSYAVQEWYNLIIGGGYYDINNNQPYYYKANVDISNFAIFNYALSDAEISQIYNSGLEGKPVVCANEVESSQTPYTLHDTLITTLQNSWVWDTSVTNQPLITKHGDRIFLNGIISKSGSVNADEVLFTLPVGMRPQIPDTYFRSFTVSSRDSGAPSARIIRVYGNGNVTAMLSGGTIVNPMLSLDNISFRNGK